MPQGRGLACYATLPAQDSAPLHRWLPKFCPEHQTQGADEGKGVDHIWHYYFIGPRRDNCHSYLPSSSGNPPCRETELNNLAVSDLAARSRQDLWFLSHSDTSMMLWSSQVKSGMRQSQGQRKFAGNCILSLPSLTVTQNQRTRVEKQHTILQ